MQISHRKLIGLAVALLAAPGAAAALASTDPSSSPLTSSSRRSAPPAAVSPSTSVVDAFPVFRSPEQASYRAGQERLKAGFDRGEADHFSQTDFSLARPIPIAGTDAQAWIAPSGDHVCVFIPDPTEGYGAVCSSLAEIEAGKAAIAALVDPSQDGSYGPLHGGAIVTVVTPNGTGAPELADPAGKTAALSAQGNLAAAEVPAGAIVITGSGARAVLNPGTVLSAGP